MRTVVLLVMALVVVGCAKKDEDGGGGDWSRAEVPAIEIYHAYRDGNVATADQKYLNKSLRVKGRVLKIEQGANGEYGVGLETGPNVIPGQGELKAAIVAVFPAIAREQIAKLHTFDTVVIDATCKGRTSSSGRMGGILILLESASLISQTPHDGKHP